MFELINLLETVYRTKARRVSGNIDIQRCCDIAEDLRRKVGFGIDRRA
nr:hypothetical protein [Ensifer sp. NM-2]